MLRALRGNSLGVIFVIFITSVLLSVLSIFFKPENVLTATTDQTLNAFNYLLNIKIEIYPWFNFILCTGLFTGLAYYLNFLNKKHIVLTERTQLPAFFYVIIAGSIIYIFNHLIILIYAYFFLFALNIIYTTPKRSNVLDKRFFEASFLLALGSLFSFNYIILLVIIPISLIINNNYKIRVWLLSIIGALIPYIIVYWIHYLFDTPLARFEFEFTRYENFIFIGRHDIAWLVFLIYSSFILLISGLYTLRTYQLRKIQSRKNLMVLFWLFIIVFVNILIGVLGRESVLIIAFSAAFQYSNYFQQGRVTRFKSFSLILLIILGILSKVLVNVDFQSFI